MDARSARQRAAAGRLHALLLARTLLPPAAYLRGVRHLLDAAVDLATDVPAVWQNVAQLLAPPLLAPAAGVTLSALAADAAPGCVRDGGGATLTVALLKRLTEESEERARQLVPAGFPWHRLLGDRPPLQLLTEVSTGCGLICELTHTIQNTQQQDKNIQTTLHIQCRAEASQRVADRGGWPDLPHRTPRRLAPDTNSAVGFRYCMGIVSPA